jgi:DNA polymerase-3 subunit gamma/tau
VQAVLAKFPGAQIVNVVERSDKGDEGGVIDAETEILGEADAIAAHEAEADDDLD